MKKIKLFAAVDWARSKNYYVIKNQNFKVLSEGYFDNSSAGYEIFLAQIQSHRKGDEKVAVIFEGTRGAALNALIGVDYLELYPVNPIKTKKLNELDGASMGKNDKRDSHLLCDYLISTISRLAAPYIERDSLMRHLQQWVSLESDLIALHTKNVQRIRQLISDFCPELAQIITDFEGQVYLNYLLKFNPIKLASQSTITTFLHKHNMRSQKKIEAFVQGHKRLKPLGTDKEFQRCQWEQLCIQVELLKTVKAQLKQCQSKVEALFVQLPQAHIYSSMPSVGPRLGPRLAALMGSQPQKAYANARQANSYFGQSPLTESSGGNGITSGHYVKKRTACNKDARHVCFLWSNCIAMQKTSQWAVNLLNKKKEQGDKTPTRYRKLGKKLVAILYTCLTSNTKYDEAIFLKNCHEIII